MDRLSLLATFARVAERGSISAAARDLGLSQPSVSRQLAELERLLGVELARRTTHELTLTETGRELLGDGRALLASWDALEERYRADAEMLTGKLKVVAPIALGQAHLVDIALRFQKQHPGITLDWRLDDETIRFTEVGCDCWIKVGMVPDDRLIIRSLGEVERLIVAAPSLLGSGPAQMPSNVEKWPLAALAPFEGGRIRLTNRQGQARVIEPEVRFITDNIVALRQATLSGVGFAVLPRWFIQAELDEGRLIDPLPNWRALPLTVRAAFLPSRRQPRRLRRFLDHLQQEMTTISGIAPPRS
ncbi:MAG: LysR family transcriptional regulator [Geminicoccaceae bacterium]